jgi:Tfp pilus assembly protein PilF
MSRSEALHAQGQWALAHAVVAEQLAQHPDDVAALARSGALLRDAGRHDEALLPLNRALERAPTHLQALFQRALVWRQLDRLTETVADYDRLLAVHPRVADAHFNRANALRELNLLPEAVASYRQALRLRPDHAEAQCNLACTLLLAGDYEEGLATYEWRWRARFIQEPAPTFEQPAWRGQHRLQGKTLLLYTEQGLGDTLQFVRLLRVVAGMGARVILQAPQLLFPLLSGTPGLHVLVAKGLRELPPFDFHCPLMSLPYALRLRPPNLGWAGPYLRPQVQRMQRWQPQLARPGLRIGVCWQGAQPHTGPGKSFDLAHLAGVAALPGITLYSLQKGPGVEQLDSLPAGMVVQSFGGGFDSDEAFMDSAAVIAQLDLVITADTAVAHLAGALGRPVWLLLKFSPDWRWGLAGSSTPWYPSMRLFRQPARGHWQPCFAAIERHLKAWLASTPAAQR